MNSVPNNSIYTRIYENVWCLYIVCLENLRPSFLVAPWTYHGRKNRITRFLRFGLACKKCILCNYCSCSVDDSCILLVVPDNSLYTSDLDNSVFKDDGEDFEDLKMWLVQKKVMAKLVMDKTEPPEM